MFREIGIMSGKSFRSGQRSINSTSHWLAPRGSDNQNRNLSATITQNSFACCYVVVGGGIELMLLLLLLLPFRDRLLLSYLPGYRVAGDHHSDRRVGGMMSTVDIDTEPQLVMCQWPPAMPPLAPQPPSNEILASI